MCVFHVNRLPRLYWFRSCNLRILSTNIYSYYTTIAFHIKQNHVHIFVKQDSCLPVCCNVLILEYSLRTRIWTVTLTELPNPSIREGIYTPLLDCDKHGRHYYLYWTSDRHDDALLNLLLYCQDFVLTKNYIFSIRDDS